MSKRSKARRNDLIRSMEGLSVLKAPESKPAAPAQPKPGKPAVRYAIGLMAGIVFVAAAAGLWVLRH
jgi:hypothetical protein